ncbi:thiolase C-terminal domain-containing protein [Nocardioides sp. B-3]|uniref:thiolase C-terminal domain-containing protein n=1 Tax=Nocardioides sp. B-3 TaxID=2895565 RepID=UPI00215397A1|nr:lipid-transfer protein [Nocardioides sp. B-3]UUZ59523.1 lipid-transfer protein [Nocardioides sp. B-3]
MESPIIAGVGMTPFTKPGASATYDVMAADAVRRALSDAGLELTDVDRAYAAYVYGDSTSGQRGLYHVGKTGMPIVNVNNNCSSGSTALWLASQAVRSGTADCALAFGFEQMQKGALNMMWTDRPSPVRDFIDVVARRYEGTEEVPMALLLFGAAGADYMERYGTRPETFLKVTVKARQHARSNANAVFRDPVTVEQVLASPRLFKSLTRLQACPPTNGAAAVIVCTSDFARAHDIDSGTRIPGQGLATDTAVSFDPDDLSGVVGYGVTEQAAAAAYEQAGLGPGDVDVVELHDCFTVNEILAYEALGLTAPGTSEKFIEDGDNTYGGRVVVNPSGGLLSKGHPIGATGLAQITELTQQLRGAIADGRQVEGARIGLQHNIGVGGAGVVTVLG